MSLAAARGRPFPASADVLVHENGSFLPLLRSEAIAAHPKSREVPRSSETPAVSLHFFA